MAPPLWAQHALSPSLEATASSAHAGSSSWQPFEPLLPSSAFAPLSRPTQRLRPRSFRLTSPASDAPNTPLSPADILTLARALRLAHLEPGPASQSAAAASTPAAGAASEAAPATAEALFLELVTCMLPSHSAAWLLDVVRQSSWAPAPASSTGSGSSSSNELRVPEHAMLSAQAPRGPRTGEGAKRERKPAPPPGLAPALAPAPLRVRATAHGSSSGGEKPGSEEAEVEHSLLASLLSPTSAERQKRRRSSSAHRPAGPRPQPPPAPADGEALAAYEEALRGYRHAMRTWTRRKEREEKRARRRERRLREEREQQARGLVKQAPDEEDEWQDISSTSLSLPHVSSHVQPAQQRALQKPFDVYAALPAHIKAKLPKRGRGRPSNAQRRVWEEALLSVMAEQEQEPKREAREGLGSEREKVSEHAAATDAWTHEEMPQHYDSATLLTAPSASRTWTTSPSDFEDVASGSGSGSGPGSGYGTPFDAAPQSLVNAPFEQAQLHEPWPASARSESTPASFASGPSRSSEPALDPRLGGVPASSVEGHSLHAPAPSTGAMPEHFDAPAPAQTDVHLRQQSQQHAERPAYIFSPTISSPPAGRSNPFAPFHPAPNCFADSSGRAMTPEAPLPAPPHLPPLGGGWTSSPLRAVTPEPPAPWLSPEYAAHQQPRFTPLRPRPPPPVFAPVAAGAGSPRSRTSSSNNNSGSAALTTAQWLAAATQMARESEMPYIHDVDRQRVAASNALAGPSSSRATQHGAGVGEPPAKRARGRPRKGPSSSDRTETQATASRLPLLPNERVGAASHGSSSSGKSANRSGRPSGARKVAAPLVPLREVTTRSRRGGPAPKMPLPTFWLTPKQRAEKARQRRMAALAEVAESSAGGTAEGEEREKSPSMKEMLASFADEINAE